MHGDQATLFSAQELDILQELMNIGFGTAGAALAEVLGRAVALSVPSVKVVPAVLLRHYVSAEIQATRRISVVEQRIDGAFDGSAHLVLQAGEGTGLVPLPAGARVEAGGWTRPERSAAAEWTEEDQVERVGKLLIERCVGKMAEVLGTVPAFGAASVTVDTARARAVRPDVDRLGDTAVVLQTSFHLDDQGEAGFLFLTIGRESVARVKAALHRFMQRYA